MWSLRGVIGGVILEYFALLRRVLGAMQQACFTSGQPIAMMDCIYCPALVSADRLGVGSRSVFSSISFPAMTGTVGVFHCLSLKVFPPSYIFFAISIFSNS